MIRTSFDEKRMNYLKKNGLLILLMILFMMGMIYGSLMVKSQFFSPLSLSDIQENYIKNSDTFLGILFSSFFSNYLFVLIPYLLGYSSISQIITVFIPLFNGLGLGLSMGFLYSNLGLGGIGYSLLIIVPQTAVSLFAIFIACRESIKLSNLFLKGVKNSDSINFDIIKLYNIKFVVLTIITAISALIHSISIQCFSGLFIQ